MILIKQFFILKSLELIACFLDVQLLIIYFEKKLNGKLVPINYNGGERKPRQKIIKKYLENGSIYIFNKDKFIKENIRLFGNIGIYEMNNYKSLRLMNYQM